MINFSGRCKFIKFFFALFAIGLAAIQPAIAQVNLNPAHGDPSYKAYTVFSPDASKPEAAREDVIVVFHGFTSAIPNGTYKRVRKTFKKTHTVIGINYDPQDVERTLAFLDAVEKKWLRGRRTVVLGTSVGGFWANVFGHRIEAQKIILLNPVTDPARQLLKYVGEQVTNKRRAQTTRVEAAAIERYATLSGLKRNGRSRLIVLTADDATLNFRVARDAFAGKENTNIMIFPKGGHTLDLHKHPARASIVDFVSNH